jgi:hypothetical protein
MFSLTPSVSPIEEGRQYKTLLDEGLSVEEIADRAFQMSVSHVRHRLQMVQLLDEQAAAHAKA